MSAYHCSCGFAIDEVEEFGDHLQEVFDRDDETGTDGRVHIEVIPTEQPQPPACVCVCACGFQAPAGTAEFDDHLLLVRLPPDSIGNDGEKHILVDPSTPVRWFIPEPDE